MKEKIEKIVKEVVTQFAIENNIAKLKNPDLNTVLFGFDSVIDSIGLVTIIVEVESNLYDELGIQVSLADEKAMSQLNTPFKTVGSLTEYIAKIISNQP
jgi:acyl carrier protein